MAVAFSLIGLVAISLFSVVIDRAFGLQKVITLRSTLDALPWGIVTVLLIFAILLVVNQLDSFWLLGSVLGALALALTVGSVRHGLPIFAPRFTFFSLGMLCLVLLAIYVRRDPTNFIYMTGDMGEYVNMASNLARSGRLVESFPHLFTAYLSGSVIFFGPEAAVFHFPLLGVLAALLALKVMIKVEVNQKALVFVFIVAGFGLMPVWFSKLPVSETLYGLILLMVFVSVVEYLNKPRASQLALLGFSLMLLGLTRGNALVLSVVVIFTLYLSLLVGADRKVIASMVMVSVLGTFVAYLYNIERLPTYYLDFQLFPMIGPEMVSLGKSLGLFKLGPPLVFAFVLGLVLALLPCYLSKFVGSKKWIRPVAYTSTVLVALGSVIFASGAFYSSLPALGYLVCTFAIVGSCLGIREQRISVQVLLMLSLLVLSSSVVLFSLRINELTHHAYFLYWQRYLFGDFFWGLLILAGVGFSHFCTLMKFDRKGLIPLLVLVLVAFESVTASRKLWSRAIFEDSFTHVSQALVYLGNRPNYFSGFGPGNNGKPDHWFFPNMWRAYGYPMVNLFGVRFENLNPGTRPPFGSDPRPNLEQINEDMALKGLTQVNLLMVNKPSAPEELNFWNEVNGEKGAVRWEEVFRQLNYVRLIPASTEAKEIKFLDMPIEIRVYRISRIVEREDRNS